MRTVPQESQYPELQESSLIELPGRLSPIALTTTRFDQVSLLDLVASSGFHFVAVPADEHERRECYYIPSISGFGSRDTGFKGNNKYLAMMQI